MLLGAQQELYECSVVNLIASDNAFPKIQHDLPPYGGYMIQEGLRGQRPFAGATLHDQIENLASDVACEVFGAEHSNLQPHSCSQANQAVYHGLLEPGDAVLALSLRAGGHLTHGLKTNFSGRMYRFHSYDLGRDGRIDYASAAQRARQVQPKLVVCGASSYPRLFDAERLREIADEVGAFLMFDLSHEAGLIAAKVIPNPVPLSDVSTMSLDKTLRGPFGGLVLCRSSLASRIDRAIHPGTQSSFPIRRLTDAAYALLLTRTQWFQDYAAQVLANAKELERSLEGLNGLLVTGGTDKHYLVLDVRTVFGLSGSDAERILESVGILTNRQFLFSDASSRMSESGGLRIGTPWATSRGYTPGDFHVIANLMLELLSGHPRGELLKWASVAVKELASRAREGDVWT